MITNRILTQNDVDEWLDKTKLNDYLGVNDPLYINNGLLLRRNNEGSLFYRWEYIISVDAPGYDVDFSGSDEFSLGKYERRENLPSLETAIQWYERRLSKYCFEVKVNKNDWKDIREIRRVKT